MLALHLLVFGLHRTIPQAGPTGAMAVRLAAAIGAVLVEGLLDRQAAGGFPGEPIRVLKYFPSLRSSIAPTMSGVLARLLSRPRGMAGDFVTIPALKRRTDLVAKSITAPRLASSR